jgi:ribose transport system permease protein
MTDEQDRTTASHSSVDAVLEDLEGELHGEAAVGAPATKRGPLAALLRMREISVLGATVVLFAALSLSAPTLFPVPNNLLLVARQISILAIIAIGMTFLFIAREIDLSAGSTYGFLVVCLAFLITKWSLDPWLAVLVTVFVGIVVGFVNGMVVTQFGIPSFIVTLGMLSILRGLALLLSGAWPILIKLPPEHSFLNITAGRAWGTVPMQVLWMIGLMLIASFVLRKTRFGAHVYATGGNEEAAILTGIPTKRVKVICFMMISGLCGIAAALLLGQMRSGYPLTGVGFELDIIAAVVIGGTPLFGGAGSVLGTLLGAAILGMITNGLVLLGASAHFEPVAKGLIIVGAILLDTLIRQRQA